MKIKADGIEKSRFGVDLGRWERGQVKAIGDVIHRISREFAEKSLHQVMDEYGSDFLSLLPARGEYAEPRKQRVFCLTG